MSALARHLMRPQQTPSSVLVRIVAVVGGQQQQQQSASFSSKDSDSFYKVVGSKIRLDG